jgi:hypothetical protein
MAVDLNHPSPVAVGVAMPLMRYMDVGKFFDLVSTGELHFTRLDLFRIADPREGRLPDIVRRDMKDICRMSGEEIEVDPRFVASRGQGKALKMMAENVLGHMESFANTTFVHCWHLGSTESMAMWNSYAGRGAAVVISSSVGALADALKRSGPEMIGGAMKYIDPNAVAAELGICSTPSFESTSVSNSNANFG